MTTPDGGGRLQCPRLRWFGVPVLALGLLALSVVLPGRAAPSSLPGVLPAGATSEQMAYGPATDVVGVGADPRLAPTTPVWVVRVDQPEPYTEIVDGRTGAVLDSQILLEP